MSPSFDQSKPASASVLPQLITLAHTMACQGLVWGSSGNISARSGASHYYISGTGTWLGKLEESDCACCSLDDGVWSGGRAPSKEAPMHRAVYRARPEAAWVLHASPLYTTLLAAQHRLPDDRCCVEALAYLGEMSAIPYFQPGSEALANAVETAARTSSIILMENHGVLVWDRDPQEALMRLMALEFACRLDHEAACAGRELLAVEASLVRDFREKRLYSARKTQ